MDTASIVYLHDISEQEIFEVTNPVDELGRIRAEIAALKESEERLIAQIKEAGVGAYDGVAYRATVSEVAPRESYDTKAMEAKLRDMGVDNRWFIHNTKTTAGYVTVRVSARKSK